MARRRGAFISAVLALAAAVVAACTPPPVAPLIEDPPTDRPCAVAAIRSCALPYPSDEFAISDPTSQTGLRLAMPEGLIDESVMARFGPGASLEDAFDGADGYSAITPVIFEIDGRVRPSQLPEDGGDIVAVYDAATGERVAVRVEVAAEAERHGAPETIVAVWPRVRYEYGRTYIARVADDLVVRSASPPSRPAGFSAGGEHVSSLRDDIERIEGAGAWAGVLSATRFTIRSSQDATERIDTMAAIVRSHDHPLRRVRVERPFPLLHPDIAAVVHGEVSVTDFRDEDGVARAEHTPQQRWVPFLMMLPDEPAGAKGAPVAIYGHGLIASKETMLFTAGANASKGVATIGIDVPNHGERLMGNGGFLLELNNPRAFGRLVSMPLQGTVDQVSLLMAVRDHLGSLQLTLPPGLFQPAGAAVALDTSVLLYEGTSMGGVLGAGFTALAPELNGSMLQVAGTGVADIIFHSLLWPLFMTVIPEGVSAGDALALMGAATMLLDPGDHVNLIERVAENGTPLFLLYGAGDDVVPDVTSDRLITLADLPLVGRTFSEVSTPHRRIEEPGVPADGRGAVQIWPMDTSEELRPFLAHLVFVEHSGEKVLKEWLDNRLAAAGVTR